MDRLEEIFEENSGPPVNIEAIIRAIGIELDKKASLDSEVSGQIETLPNGQFKISVNKSDHYFRQRFTMAHELGHYFLHAHLIGDGVDDNKAYRSVPAGRFHNTLIGQAEETQANRFAASVLMPAAAVRSLWNDKKISTMLPTSFEHRDRPWKLD